jgi:hypothetical protein
MIDCTFKSTKILIHDILDSVDKPIVPGHCGFPLANLYFELGVDYVPQSNPHKILILLSICSGNQTKSRTQDVVCGFLFNLDFLILICDRIAFENIPL